MSQKILQINFKYHVSRAEYETAVAPLAEPIAAVPGLVWKVWLMNEAEQEAGGIHLFADGSSLDAYLNSDIVAGIVSNPVLSDFSVKQFEVMEGVTAVTRGPVGTTDRAVTFGQMAAAALAAVPSLTPAEAQQRLAHDPNTLVIDVRDAADIAQTGAIPGAVNLSYGALTYLADNEVPEDWRDPRLADRSRPIITTCILGPLGALGGKLLHDMGFTDVHILAGGVQAWIEAGLPTQPTA